ncbi:G-D-S-L family lipolytic protein [Aggregatimonas sangjinii]|uniref:G-D-S-L family lipolytic protein n=1 Tax=Aggregatimonas sangjinii TaxID=2583587 RepID=A0A5B7SR02_9FLAO|nr:GDSL-type esterase/lipase family protein [Aggregatimonas sangjinii]QCW99359.1 G-D-S-L family lipolytic protein [Aggregatimonas sangjinii]
MKKFVLFLLLLPLASRAQDPARFAEEIASIQQKYDTLWDASKETIVFTGSSSVRIWKTLESSFPNHQIVNSGFGGSEASDLLAYSNELIYRFQPKKVFIYEGDNDINSKKRPKKIISDMQLIIAGIRAHNPETKIVLIAAKPSLARWNYRRNYKRLNRKFRRLSQNDDFIDYVDVWKPMLDGRKVKKDIFIEDGLHMNEKGYRIWYDTIKGFVEE